MATMMLARPVTRILDNQEVTVIRELNHIVSGYEKVYIPTAAIPAVLATETVNVYLELETYPFFRRFKELMESQSEPKGVFRYRRMCKQDTAESLLIEDLFVITSLFGDPDRVHVKRTVRNIFPFHVIVTLKFPNGTMAHVEYTLTDKEQIELEWNGIQQIVEFCSDEMNASISDDRLSSSLDVSAIAVIATAHKQNESFMNRLKKCHTWIKEMVG